MVGTVSYVRLLTTDFDSSFEFYKNTLEFDVHFNSENFNYTEFDGGAIKISLFDRKAMQEALDISSPQDIHECDDKVVLILEVDDVEKEYQALKDKGVVFLAGPKVREDWGVKTAHLRDPEGNIIEINSPITN